MKSAFLLPAKLHGAGPVKFEWQPRLATYIATVGVNNIVHIFDRHGELADKINLAGACTGMAWSPDGSRLAMIQDRTGALSIWDANMKIALPDVETNMKGLRFVVWNSTGDQLAVGTTKGNLLLYDHRSSKKIPILGKHSKAIIAGAWDPGEMMACGSEDRSFTLSNPEGSTMVQKTLKGEPGNMQFSSMRMNPDQKPETVLSMTVGSKTLFLYVRNSDSQFEFAFEPKYGLITAYTWYANGKIMIGFSTGYVVVVSTNDNDLGKELFQGRNHKDNLTDLAISHTLSKVATCGDISIRVQELADLKDMYAIITLDEERGLIEQLRWSDDGQFLTAGCKSGNIYTYISRLPIIGGAYGTSVALLTSLVDVSIFDMSKQSIQNKQMDSGFTRQSSNSESAETSAVVKVEVEPTAIGLSSNYLAVGFNARAWFYLLGKGRTGINQANGNAESLLILEKEYLGTIQSICMNEQYAAVLFTEGKLQVHTIPTIGTQTARADDTLSISRLFPEPDVASSAKRTSSAVRITCIDITPDFVIYGTNTGLVHYYALGDWVLVNEFKHKIAIKGVFPEASGGSKLLLLDTQNAGYICSPVNDYIHAIPGLSAKTQGFLWDAVPQEKGTTRSHRFVAYDDAFLTLFIYNQYTIKGPQCVALGTTKLPYGLKPILYLSGTVMCQTQGGKVNVINISSFEDVFQNMGNLKNLSEVVVGKTLQLTYALGMIQSIWSLQNQITSTKPWKMLADAALHILDLPTALRIYRQQGFAALSLSLEKLEGIEDRNLLSGHIAVIMSDFAAAQDFFLSSSNPIAALELRRDLLQWDQALNLANSFAPKEVTTISLQYAQQLEFQGLYSDAKGMYEKSSATEKDYQGSQESRMEHHRAIQNGLTRMTLRTGDLARGLKMVNDYQDPTLLGDCGAILETLKQYTDAATLYEKGKYFEKAAENWLKAKNYSKVGELLSNFNSPKIQIQYAKAKEAEGKYEEAARVYALAKNFDNVVRIYVEHLHNLDEAVNIVRKTKSRESAKYVSKFLQSVKDYKAVVEFYLMADMKDEAFSLAQAHDIMGEYAEYLGDDATTDMLANIATYFEDKGDHFMAGKYLIKCGKYPRALKMFLRCPSDDNKALDMAIETVGLAKNDALTHELIDYLMGETDGTPKDANYIFKLYVSLGQYKEAARTAIIIAREEQTLGNYRAAHDLLFDNCRQLQASGNKVPADIERMLMILHSYMLIKVLIRADEHVMGARMLIRVANNISKFPSHVLQILTSTVIECQRVGLKKSAFEYAALIMRPEYRNVLDDKYKRKIEAIVRRPSKEEEEEPKTPCPYCDNPVAETNVDCVECRNHLPYCVATGRHMVLNDWTCCPFCKFPALYSCFRKLLEKGTASVPPSNTCPMCNSVVKPESLVLMSDPLQGHEKTVSEPEAVSGY